MSVSLRRSLLALVVIAATSLLTACSDPTMSEAGAVGAATDTPGAIGLETSNLFLSVSNNAGQALVDVVVAIQPVGNAPPFTASVRRIENSETREISLANFRGNDGTNFSPRMFRAREVTVTATDIVGKKYQLTKPWGR
jgi:hypothetical protein